MTLQPSTPTSRNLRVNARTVVASLTLDNGLRYVVDPPFVCEPGKHYRAELDADAGTATITEIPAEEATHE